MSKLRLDSDQFFSSVKTVYDYWKTSSDQNAPIRQAKTLAFIFGNNKNETYSKSSSIHKWLFGYELTDTVIIFTKSTIHIATGKKKLEFLNPIKDSNKENQTCKFLFYAKPKGDFDELVTKLADIMGKNPKLGFISKDIKSISSSTEFSQQVSKKIPSENVDISADLACIMGPKSRNELKLLQESAKITTHIYNKGFKDSIMRIIDKDKKVKHSKLSEELESMTEDKDKCAGFDPEMIETAYPPIIQSGGNYALKYSAQSSDEVLHFGTISTMFGIKYKSYCSNIGRCLMVNPNDKQMKVYEKLCELEDFLIAELKPGAICSDIYSKVNEKCPESLRKNLTKTFGSIIGIEFKDSAVMISPKCNAKVTKNMVFNVSIGFQDMQNADASNSKSKAYSLFLADTVQVVDGGESNLNFTAAAKKRLKSCKIDIIDDEEEDDGSEADEADPERDFTSFGRGLRNKESKHAVKEFEENEKKRQNNQQKLLDKMNKLALERLRGGENEDGENKIYKDKTSYTNLNQLPYHENEMQQHKIVIDRKNETILIPIQQIHYPIHMSMIKNVTLSVEGVYQYLRINFYYPGSTLGRGEGANFNYPETNFLKELTFRCQKENSQNLETAARMVRETQKRMRTKEQEEKEKKGLVKQDKLVILSQNRNPRLKDLYMRPSLGQKRVPGLLEAHSNGFRYANVKQERIDILYNNIKHAIFQPCDNEMIMVLHFKLKNFILLNKKKVQDIQFYVEVGEITTDLMKGQNIRDRDDLYAEQREREMRHKLKNGFKSFIEKVESISKDVDFDSPYRELGFQGAPHKSTCMLQPTSQCLINVIEWPAFVVSLDDIECVHFERVTFSIKNFDMVIVYKDYSNKVSMINSIPIKSLEEIKNWLNSCDIRYTEGVTSLNWPKIMKAILEDVEGFFEQGGWDFLATENNATAEDEDEELEKAEDEDFDVSEKSGSDEDGGDDSDDYSDEDSEENFSEESDDSGASEAASEESGKDWDELENEAKRADNERGEYDEDEGQNDRHRGNKRKGGGAPPPKSKKQKRR